MEEFLHITETPDALQEAIARNLVAYSIGFVRVEGTPQENDVLLLGSGTLVAIGETRAVLTAAHVIRELPQKGRLGLALSDRLDLHNVDTRGLTYKKIAHGSIVSKGPDLGVVILAPTIAGAIAAKKTFYNLAKRRKQMLQTPPALSDGLWVVNGFVDEWTREEPSDRYRLVKIFCNFSGIGAPEPPVSDGEHDYFAFPISYGQRSVAPKSFGGMSGGGLWQIPIMRDAQGKLNPKTLLLSGVVFYQEPTTENQCGVKCHGRQSVYRVAYDSLQNKEP